jgi:putative polyhydroxyalkanoate system protein
VADIDISVAHGTDRETARGQADAVLRRMAAKMGLTVSWTGDRAELEGTGLKSGQVTVDDTEVTVSVRLALMAKPMQGMIEEKIRDGITRALSA